MKYLPVNLDIAGRPCLVVGGGDVALRKVRMLLKAGAQIELVARTIHPDLVELLDSDTRPEISHQRQLTEFQPGYCDGKALAIAATDDGSVNREVSEAAKQRGIPVNVVDEPGLSTFVFPAIIDRDPLVISVSSGGASPVLARSLRAEIETLVPSRYGQLARLLGEYREAVKQAFHDIRQRRRFWESVIHGPAAQQILAGKEAEGRALIEQGLKQESAAVATSGEVYLVGSGPGDPDLLTFRALRLMQQADVVLYDRLVSEPILDLVRRDADRIYVGKAKADHALPQGQINEALVALAREGKRVLRLKGGDPFIFGRGGEEIELLMENRIPFQVVPGITAASGCAAYAGIPLTHRDYAQSVRFVTAHLKEGTVDLDWGGLVQPNQTLVFYMGLSSLEQVCQKLVENGMAPETPIALIEKGTRPEQRVFSATLASIENEISNKNVRAPTLIIVGGVVRLRDRLNWFG